MNILGIYKAIIFDYDDTLVLTFQNYVERDLEACRKLKLNEPTRFQYMQSWGLPWREMVRHLHPDVSPDTFIKGYTQMHSSEVTEPIPHLKELFATLHKEGYVLGIISSKPSRSLHQRVLFFDIKKHLTFCYGEEDTIHHKPDPRVFKEVLEKLNESYRKAQEILYVGDLVSDFSAAKGAGLSFVAVLTGPTTRRELLDAGVPDKDIIKSVNDLPSWLEEQKDK